MASQTLQEIQADIALNGLSNALGKFDQGALSAFTHGSEAIFDHVKRTLKDLMTTLGEADALRQSVAESDESTQTPINA